MSGDLRLFDYALAPQLQRLHWRLDKELGDVARLLETQERLRAQGQEVDAQVAAAVQADARGPAAAIDPQRARRLLEYLATLQQRRAVIDADLRRNEAQVAELRGALARTQREVEKLEVDRGDLLAQHLREVDRRHLREADQDWIARAAWRDGAGAALERQS